MKNVKFGDSGPLMNQISRSKPIFSSFALKQPHYMPCKLFRELSPSVLYGLPILNSLSVWFGGPSQQQHRFKIP